ncbi:magnesium chelatase subunit D [Sphingomonas radiodurans]|uniref:magnesium chelatase subunit D n=1 Tax=Sphingomonas radiodurans TaxID=2890321 RepID=UPI001E4D03E3|nr:magnesium chelatase subunit D [Sphingomonas radiodurans]WBH15565.1 magnesium chelatase subunit D [Sphingomonas radiodurans]
MSGSGDSPPEVPNDPLHDALIAARLCAIDPGLGGLILRGGDSLRDLVVDALRAALPAGAPVRRIPAHIDDDRLLGGIDLTSTLALGRSVTRTGLLVEADGGAVVVPMAERMSDALAGRLAAVLDTGEVVVERDGAALRGAARFVTVALDDGEEPDERPPAALAERLAFWIDLSGARAPSAADIAAPAVDRHARGAIPTPEILEALTATAAVLGIDSIRAPMFALRAARASANLNGRESIANEDLVFAARVVLAPRATQLPPPEAESESRNDSPPPENTPGDDETVDTGQLDDVVLEAVLAALPKDMLARLAAGRGRKASGASGAGERRKSSARGRPMGARAGVPGGGLRLSLIDTLRAAAPWQKLRGGDGRIQVRRDDLRIRRFETRAEAVTIFAVDASGSSALARLAEAKGAVELLLAEAYVKRAQVALVAFRGRTAELLLPPTRSLARARRSLAELPGGGGTPLAAGLNAARELAEASRARGRTPFVVVLTDGRANIAADGSTVRSVAEADATAAAKAIGAAGIAAAFVDISARPRPEGAALAAAMRARYLPLPRADAAAMHAAVSAAQRQ